MNAVLTLLTTGVHTLIVDAGRPRSRSLGVPMGGAADRFSLAVANALVGNSPDTPALEITLAGPSLVTDAPVGMVLFGAPFAMHTPFRQLVPGQTFVLQPREELHIGTTGEGIRAYLAVAGGFDVPTILNSRSSLTCLTPGTAIPCASRTVPLRRINSLSHPDRCLLHVLPGPQAKWFPSASLGPFRVSTTSNRMGIRLEGKPLPFPDQEMVSEPVCPGTVQVTREGQLIVLGVDGQTIGGYPKIAQVIRADLDKLGQLRPGWEITFKTLTLAEAGRHCHHRDQLLKEWLTRISLGGMD